METKIVVFESFILIGLYDESTKTLKNAYQVMIIQDKLMLAPFLFGITDGTLKLNGSHLVATPTLELIKRYNDASTAGNNSILYS